MIAIGFAVVLFIVAAILLGGAFRAWPPGTYRRIYLHPTTVSDIVLMLGLSTAAVVGVLLLLLL